MLKECRKGQKGSDVKGEAGIDTFFSGWTKRVEYTPGSGSIPLFPSLHLETCEETVWNIQATVELQTGHIGKGCDRDSYSDRSVRRLCGGFRLMTENMLTFWHQIRYFYHLSFLYQVLSGAKSTCSHLHLLQLTGLQRCPLSRLPTHLWSSPSTAPTTSLSCPIRLCPHYPATTSPSSCGCAEVVPTSSLRPLKPEEIARRRRLLSAAPSGMVSAVPRTLI